MSVSVLEYLGQNVENPLAQITPATPGEIVQCPFMCAPCHKVKKKQKPVCSVRKATGEVWIVCPDRLCSSLKKSSKKSPGIPLSAHQKDVLFQVAKLIYGKDIPEEEILVKREVSIPVVKRQIYKADYIMSRKTPIEGQPNNVVLEMQGGGETSSTKNITNHVDKWEKNPALGLAWFEQKLKAESIETNAWRRQQEQFIVKGNVACNTTGRIVFCVGEPLHNYLWERLKDESLKDLKGHGWTLALVCFKESKNSEGNIRMVIDEGKSIFTSYSSFLQILINQGKPCPPMFAGEFMTLDNQTYKRSDC